MVETGAIISVLSFLTLWFVLVKLPCVIRQLIVGYILLSDVLAVVLIYIVFGGGVYALMGAGFTSLWVSIGLVLAKRYSTYAVIRWRIRRVLRFPIPQAFLEYHAPKYSLPGWYIRVSSLLKRIMTALGGKDSYEDIPTTGGHPRDGRWMPTGASE